MTRHIPRLIAAAALMATIPATSVMAQTEFKNWGQEVKECNQTNCYPGGTKRGAYVREQARDAEGPGYGHEIHTLAKPGKSQAVPGGGNTRALRLQKRK